MPNMELPAFLENSVNVLKGLDFIKSIEPELKQQVNVTRENLREAQDNIITIDKAIAEAKRLDKNLSNKIKQIETESEKTLSRIAEAETRLVQLLSETEAKFKEFGVLSEFIERVDDLETLVEEEREELDGLQENLDEFEEAVKEVKDELKKKTFALASQTTKSHEIYASASNQFPSASEHFTLNRLSSVSRRKPDGIVIEGEVLKMSHWTEMLDVVIPYCMKKYNGNVDRLCKQNYATPYFATEDGDKFILPYCIKGRTDERKYKYIHECNMSVYSGGADSTVDVLRCILCDFLGINEKNVEIFYHKK